MKTDAATFAFQSGTPPTLSVIYYELSAAIEDLDSSIDDVSSVIRKDQGMVSRILRLANSAFYGLPSQVGTLGEAVQIIGLNEIKDLVLATAVISAFKMPPHLVDVASFWKHSIACGLACSLLAEEQHDPQPERFFVAGLLHDIGRLMVFLKAPKEGIQILERADHEGMLASAMEREILGFDHAELGAELVSFWKLPHSLKEMVGSHHNPAKCTTVTADAFLVHYADFIASVIGYGNSGEAFVAPLRIPKGCDTLLVSESRLPALAEELEVRCEDVFPILFTGAND